MISSYPANFSLRVFPFGCEFPFPIPLVALLIYHLNYMHYLEPFFFHLKWAQESVFLGVCDSKRRLKM